MTRPSVTCACTHPANIGGTVSDATGEIQGTCDEKFAAVREAFQKNFDDELDVGASVAVYLEGESVVDLWGGFADPDRTVPWERDSITNVWSTTKTMTNLCALILADQGELDLHGPVAAYWPEFKANDKERIEVRHLLSHTAGLSGWEEPITVEDLYDWEKVTSLLAAQKPWWEPGTASGYHALTQGYLVGEVVRRVTGQSLGTFFAKEVAGPLGGDFLIGLPAKDDARTVRVIPPGNALLEQATPEMLENPLLIKTFTNPVLSPTWPGRRRGGGPRSRPPTGRATPAAWRRCSRSSPTTGRPGGSGSCRPRGATPSSRSSRTGTTWS